MASICRRSSVSGLRLRSTVPRVTLRASFCAFSSEGLSRPICGDQVPRVASVNMTPHGMGQQPSCSFWSCNFVHRSTSGSWRRIIDEVDSPLFAAWPWPAACGAAACWYMIARGNVGRSMCSSRDVCAQGEGLLRYGGLLVSAAFQGKWPTLHFVRTCELP